MARKLRAAGVELVREWLTQDGDEIGQINRVDGGYSVNYFGVADFFVSSDGLDTRVVSTFTDSEHGVEHVYRNQILPMALSRQGRLVVHASALDSCGKCVAFIGTSGRGKSTLAASFALIGYPFLTDDGLVVTVVDGIHSGSPRKALLSLREASKQHFEKTSALPIEALLRGPKWAIEGGAQMPHCDRTLPLSGLYFLGEGVANDVQIEPMGPHQAIQLLLSNTFVLDTTDKVALQVHFRQISNLVAEVPCYSLDYPRDFDAMPLLRAQLGAHMAGDPARARPERALGKSGVASKQPA